MCFLNISWSLVDFFAHHMVRFVSSRGKWQPTPVFLPGESQGREAWWAAVYGSHRVGHDWSDLAAAAAAAEILQHLFWSSNDNLSLIRHNCKFIHFSFTFFVIQFDLGREHSETYMLSFPFSSRILFLTFGVNLILFCSPGLSQTGR